MRVGSCTILAALLLALPLAGGPALADEGPLPPAREVAAEVDALLAEAWREAGVRPAGEADDAELLRRLSLDVQGVIPAERTVVAFLAQEGAERRARLIRSLLFGRGYARSMATRWANLLLGRQRVQGAGGEQAPLVVWLGRQIAANRPWDAVVRSLVAAEGSVDEEGAAAYLLAYDRQVEEVTGNAMRVFQGFPLQCAQCHDHPFNESISQRDFWGVAAFFARAGQRRDEDRVVLVERGRGEVRLPAAPGQPRPVVRPRFVTGAEPGSDEHRRQALARLLTAPDNPWFAPATVNRVWSFFFGSGFAPPDELAVTGPAFPAVLERLARDFRQSGHDLRRLCEVILSTQAYQRTSKGGDGAAAWKQVGAFARAPLRPLEPEQLWDSLVRATGLERWEAASDEERERWLWGMRRRFFDVFAGEGLQGLGQNTIPQALSLMNGPLTNALLKPPRNAATAELLALPPARQVEALFLRILGRPPTAAEQRALDAQGLSSEEQAQLALDVTWALINSSEFSHNH